jgi:TusA-related sulfurtransferase
MATLFQEKAEGWFLLNVEGCTPPAQFFAKRVLARMRDGDVLEVVADTPCCAECIAAMCDEWGDEILEQEHGAGTYRFKIRKVGVLRAA